MLTGDNSTYTECVFPPDDLITSEVLAGLCDGDSESFMKIYLHWRKPIRSFIFNLQGSATEADDLTQDIFSALWEYREKIDTTKNIRSLLFLMAKRVSSNCRTAQRIRDRYKDTAWFDERCNTTPHDLMVEKEVDMLKNDLLLRMPPQQREIFKLSDEEELTPEQIAEKLGIKPKTVYNQLYRARVEIRKFISIFLFLFATGLSDDAFLRIIDFILN